MDMNQEELEQILLRLEPEIEGFDRRYVQLRLKMVKFFSWRRCEDPEGLADETISRTVRKILCGEEIRAANPYTYVYAVAVNVFREYLRDQKRRRELADTYPASEPQVSNDMRDCRRRCFEGLASDKTKLLVEYYVSEQSREALAKSMGLSLNAVRLQVHRIKVELKVCHRQCMEQTGKK